jgi:glucose-1-phosphate adenylyltransferase
MSLLPAFDPNTVLTVILGGGEGRRLFPLTKDRAKPAVPLACKYRFVDIPISLSINSGLKRIFLLTQYMNTSLHRHVQQTYQFDHYAPHGFIEILAAHKKSGNQPHWYQGTADAVRQNLSRFAYYRHEQILILSGDQLYRMDFQNLINHHNLSGADVTVCTMPVERRQANGLGIMQVDPSLKITHFVEKPKDESLLDVLKMSPKILAHMSEPVDQEKYLASMGIYVFKRSILQEALANESDSDFGHDIIPKLISTHNVYAYIHRGYWEDIGTIKAYYEANLELTTDHPRFNLYDSVFPIYSRGRYLPPTRIMESKISQSLISDGCLIDRAEIHNSLIGIRCVIDAGAVVKDSILMGADYFETPSDFDANNKVQQPNFGVGSGSRIERAIVDKNVRIGRNVTIRSKEHEPNMDHDLYYVRDGLTIIPKDVIIPDGMVI